MKERKAFRHAIEQICNFRIRTVEQKVWVSLRCTWFVEGIAKKGPRKALCSRSKIRTMNLTACIG